MTGWIVLVILVAIGLGLFALNMRMAITGWRQQCALDAKFRQGREQFEQSQRFLDHFLGLSKRRKMLLADSIVDQIAELRAVEDAMRAALLDLIAIGDENAPIYASALEELERESISDGPTAH